MKIFFIIIIALICLNESYPQNKNPQLNKTATSSYFQKIRINQWEYWISNMGQAATLSDGFYPGGLWPGAGQDPLKSPINGNGLIWIGQIDNKMVSSRATIRFGQDPYLQAGKIFDDGTPSNPKDKKNRIYRIRKGWETMPIGPERDQFEKDYNEWPADEGAPWVDIDGDGVFFRGVDQPLYQGDEVLWCVSNDMDTTVLPFTFFNMGNLPWLVQQPIGLEVQSTVYGFSSAGDLGDLINYQYRIINKSGKEIKDIYLLYQSGLEFDDSLIYKYASGSCYIGVDTLLNLAYGYSIKNETRNYNIPPAVGHKILQGPIVPGLPGDSAKFKGRWIKGYKNLGMNTFSFWDLGDSVHFSTAYTYPPYFYNVVHGLYANGKPMIDPITGKVTRYILPGDPVNKTGWYAINGWPPGGSPEAVPAYMNNYYFSMGPFNMAPFDTQEVVLGIIGATGTDNINSIAELKRKAYYIQKAYDLDFKPVSSPPAPKVNTFPFDQSVMLWWEQNAENYKQGDPLIFGKNLADTTYNFEGYRVWQYRDDKGNDPVNLSVYDIHNFVSEIDDYKIINGVLVKVPVIFSNDEGLINYSIINQDFYTKQPLRNGNSYYFGVTAYGYSKNSTPTYLESAPQIIEVKPGKQKIDFTSKYSLLQNALSDQKRGKADGEVIFKIIDPSSLTGDEYEVDFSGILAFMPREEIPKDSLVYTLINATKKDTLIGKSRDFTLDTLHKEIHDGFMVLINDIGKDSIFKLPIGKQSYRIKAVEEIKEKGKLLSEPRDVFYNLNSSNQWMIKTQGDTLLPLQNINFYNNVGFDDYEIRFANQGSEYYTSGYNTISPLIRNNPKGKGRVPFEIWKMGIDEIPDKRMMIKTWDREINDTAWSQNKITGDWESIYAYENPGGTPYSEPLPSLSGTLNVNNFNLGNIIISGNLPDTGTVIKISTYKRFLPGHKYTVTLDKAQFNNKSAAKNEINDITVFPNPYFGSNSLQTSSDTRFMRFTRMPAQATIRIYSLAGVFVRKIEKNDLGQYVDWDLKNDWGSYVASGMYIAYIEMPGMGTKILKLAVIMEKEHLNKF